MVYIKLILTKLIWGSVFVVGLVMVQDVNPIRTWFCGHNFSLRKQLADFCVVGLFNDVSDLDQYMVHEDQYDRRQKMGLFSTCYAKIQYGKSLSLTGQGFS